MTFFDFDNLSPRRHGKRSSVATSAASRDARLRVQGRGPCAAPADDAQASAAARDRRRDSVSTIPLPLEPLETDPEIVFICGAARSGTTLAVDMLGLHSRLSPLYETYCVTHLAGLLFDSSLDQQRMRREVLDFMERWTEPLPLRDIPGFKKEDEVFHHGPNYLLFQRDMVMQSTRRLLMELMAGQPAVNVLRRFCRALFVEHARRDGKPVVLNKTPSYVDILPLLAELFPSAKVIHCVRDGRDVACSVLSRPWGPTTFAEAASWWVEKAGQAAAWGSVHKKSYLELRYEDLLQAPRRELDRVFKFIGVANEADKVLDNYTGDLKLDRTRVGAWKFADLEVSDDVSAFSRGRPLELLRHFGYACDDGASDDQLQSAEAQQDAGAHALTFDGVGTWGADWRVPTQKIHEDLRGTIKGLRSWLDDAGGAVPMPRRARG